MSDWTQEPPTDKQVKYLKYLGCTTTPTTKGQANALIREIKGEPPEEPRLNPVAIVDNACKKTLQRLKKETKPTLRVIWNEEEN